MDANIMSNIFHCKFGVSFNQACRSRSISIQFGNNSFGLTRTGTIFEVSETILKFLVPPKN